MSVAVRELPWRAPLTEPLQLRPLTVHVRFVPTQLRFEVQLASEPPLLPRHVHVYGPLPLTLVALPALHRLLVGAPVVFPPAAEPQDPFTTGAHVAPDCCVHEPWLHEKLALPALGGPLSDALRDCPWFAAVTEPLQLRPLTVQVRDPDVQLRFEEQLASEPPLLPRHVHVYGPLPLTLVALPELHRLLVGALVVLSPAAEPQDPFTIGAQVAPDCWVHEP